MTTETEEVIPYDVLESNIDPIIWIGKWNVRHMVLSRPKLIALWTLVAKHRTLFSDLTRGDFDNWVRYLASPDSYWLEVYEDSRLVGIINFTDTFQCIDMSAHMVFFDRQPHEKRDVCRAVMEWMFKELPINRISVSIPYMFYATVRLVEALGFKEEGLRRKAALIGGRWVDVRLYGLLREEL